MNQNVYRIIASLCFLASVGMYVIGSNSSHLSELYDLFWLPLPLGLITLLLSMKKGE